VQRAKGRIELDAVVRGGEAGPSRAVLCVAPFSPGARTEACAACGAWMWPNEHTGTASLLPGSYSRCCNGGQIILPPLQPPPALLASLHDGSHQHTTHFFDHIRQYNCQLQMASQHMKVQQFSRGVHSFKVSGQVHHFVGSVCPPPGIEPQSAYIQQYIRDPSVEAAVTSGHSSTDKLKPQLVEALRDEIRRRHKYAKDFLASAEAAVDAPDLVIVYRRPQPSEHWLKRHAYAPPEQGSSGSNEIAALVVGSASELPIYVYPRQPVQEKEQQRQSRATLNPAPHIAQEGSVQRNAGGEADPASLPTSVYLNSTAVSESAEQTSTPPVVCATQQPSSLESSMPLQQQTTGKAHNQSEHDLDKTSSLPQQPIAPHTAIHHLKQQEHMQHGSLLRMSDVHHAADALLYPLTHPNGDGGFAYHMLPHFARRGADGTALDPDGLKKGQAVPDISPKMQQARLLKGMSLLPSLDTHARKKLKFVTLNEYYSYRIQVRQCVQELCGPLAHGLTVLGSVHSV
jgi:hypothetical protein